MKITLQLLAVMVTFLLAACSPTATQDSIVGHWKPTEETIIKMIEQAEANGSGTSSNAELGQSIAKHFLSKLVIGFTENECLQYQGSRPPRAVPYEVENMEGPEMTILIDGNHPLNIKVSKKHLTFNLPGSGEPLVWQKLSPSELKELEGKVEQAKNGPGPSAPARQRFMWIISADADKAQAYLEQYPNLLQLRTDKEETLLHYAVKFGKTDLVKLALKQGAEVDAEDDFKNTALYEAATKSELNLEIIQLLLDAGADIDHQNKMNRTPFEVALQRNDRKKAAKLLEFGADLNAGAGPGEKTPFLLSCEKGQVEMVEFLLQNGADMNRTCFETEWSALRFAVMKGSIELINLLLEHGADINHEDKHGFKAILQAKDIETVKLLEKAGADINERHWNRTLLSDAIKKNNLSFAKELVNAGADIDLIVKDGKSHYVLAKEAGQTELVSLMDEVKASD